MYQNLASIFFLFVFCNANAQTALIKDPDGYCNIREKANSHSKVLDTLANERIVFVYGDQAEDNWLPVDYNKGNETHSGYVHLSRIILLTQLKNFKQVTINDRSLKLQLDSFQLILSKGDFISKNRKIQYDKEQEQQNFVKAIDEKFPWGIDGNIPKKEYRAIQFKEGKNTLNFPVKSFNDLFEPNFDITKAYIDKATKKIYVEAMNSDGAGSYVVIWTIKNMKIIRRETFIPF